MKNILISIHALPEDTRRILAGISIAVLGIGFFGFWTSFVSSRLVALNTPTEKPSATPGIPVAVRRPAGGAVAERLEPPSPAAGIAGSVADIEKFFTGQGLLESGAAGIGGLFSAIGEGLAGAAEAIYMKAAKYVPPYL
ncbi:MAG: hypothetical protein AAB533_00530 [Patescibacteria group bacterium]